MLAGTSTTVTLGYKQSQAKQMIGQGKGAPALPFLGPFLLVFFFLESLWFPC